MQYFFSDYLTKKSSWVTKLVLCRRRKPRKKGKEKKVEKKNENDDRMVESTWEAEENRGTKQVSTSESELLEISPRKDLLCWTPIFEVSIRDALLYQFCSFIFNMGLTPPPLYEQCFVTKTLK